VTNWDQLVQAFEAAIKNSPNKSLDVVIANAGIVGQDDMFTLDGSRAIQHMEHQSNANLCQIRTDRL
jgi:NAD(P)-dependent dehydrogenase (short-subunit alcohol dehydrogenase family)